MYILAIETTGAFASVALAKDDILTGKVQGHDRFSHLQNLTPQIKEVTEAAAIGMKDIDAIAVSRGPGSFTGIRIGVSTARALAQVLDIPCIPVSSLEAMALRLSDDVGSGTLICPIIDARRGQVYGGGYLTEDTGGGPGNKMKEMIKAGPYTIEEFCVAIKDHEDVIFMGDGVDKLADKIMELRGDLKTAFADESIRYQDAETVLMIGCRLFREKEICTYDKLEPDYMRMAEAERKLREKQCRK